MHACRRSPRRRDLGRRRLGGIASPPARLTGTGSTAPDDGGRPARRAPRSRPRASGTSPRPGRAPRRRRPPAARRGRCRGSTPRRTKNTGPPTPTANRRAANQIETRWPTTVSTSTIDTTPDSRADQLVARLVDGTGRHQHDACRQGKDVPTLEDQPVRFHLARLQHPQQPDARRRGETEREHQAPRRPGRRPPRPARRSRPSTRAGRRRVDGCRATRRSRSSARRACRSSRAGSRARGARRRPWRRSSCPHRRGRRRSTTWRTAWRR